MPKTTLSPSPAPLTVRAALERLPDGVEFHTWRLNALARCEVFWDRADLERLIRRHGAARAPAAWQARGYGLVVRDGLGELFIQTEER